MPFSVLSLYYTHKPGGFCKRLYRMLDALAHAGARVHYLTLDKPPIQLHPGVQVHQVPFPLPMREGLIFWLLFLCWAPCVALWYALRYRPTHVVVFGATYATILLPIRLIFGSSLILFMRSLVYKIDEINAKPLFVRFISRYVDRIGLRGATRIVFLTQAMAHEAQLFLGRALPQSTILPNDVPAAKVPRPQMPRAFDSAHPLRMLTSGVLDSRKNISFLLEVMTLLNERGDRDRVRLSVAGDGPLHAALKNTAMNSNLSNVEFLGWVSNLGPILETNDLVLHPSFHEGMSNSVLEALGAGVPVLCAETPEMSELLQSKELLFPPSDPCVLANTLHQLLQDPSEVLTRWQTLCAARAGALTFDWDKRVVELVLTWD